MSTVKVNNLQIGQSLTATQNFVLSVPVSPDGTIKLARGNQGATTADILTIAADNTVSLGTGGALVGTTATQTLTNKTLSGANITTSLRLTGAAGTAGQALLSQGAGQPPVWGTAGISTGKSIAMAIVFGG